MAEVKEKKMTQKERLSDLRDRLNTQEHVDTGDVVRAFNELLNIMVGE